jgi:UDP-glucose 4-epimerase
MKVLITGACGLVGRAVAEELGGSHDLRLLDRSQPPGAEGTAATGTACISMPHGRRWPLIRADVTDAKAMREAAEGMDAVVHLAALISGDPAKGTEIFRVNALGTFIALDAARLAGAKRFLCASSINAMGTVCYRISGRPPVYESMPVDEDFPCVPEDPYSLSKLVNEQTCAAFHRAWGITTAAFRLAGVWSAEEYARAKKAGLRPTERWSDSLYNWVHVKDVAEGIRRALEAPALPGFGVYNLCAADTTCPEPTMEILRRFRPDLAASLRAPLAGRTGLISIERARRTFSYEPRYRLGP